MRSLPATKLFFKLAFCANLYLNMWPTCKGNIQTHQTGRPPHCFIPSLQHFLLSLHLSIHSFLYSQCICEIDSHEGKMFPLFLRPPSSFLQTSVPFMSPMSLFCLFSLTPSSPSLLLFLCELERFSSCIHVLKLFCEGQSHAFWAL